MNLWAVFGNMSALATISDFLLDKADRVTQFNKSSRIEKTFQDIIDYTKIAYDIHSSADLVDQYISEHRLEMMGNVFFNEAERASFISTFFENNPSLVIYRSDVTPFLDEYLNRVERVLSAELSFPERVLLHSQTDNNTLLKEIILILKNISELKEGERGTNHKNDNVRYSSSFCETLFLHENSNDKVNLQNLFIMQKYAKSNGSEFVDTQIELDEEIEKFVKGPHVAMVIEGDGGSGKSSLISWLSYHYSVRDDVARRIFGSRQLVTVRLRDVDRTIIQKRRLISAILVYLGFKTINELVEVHPNAIVVLDGYDELCMIEGISNYETMLDDLFRKSLPNYKFIITTRPKYIDFSSSSLNSHIVRIHLKHFDKEKCEEWIKKYTIDCEEHVPEEVVAYILQDSSDDEFFICDTPMTLYMTLAKNLSIEDLSNQWELYYKIFAQELSETEYNKMIPNEQWNYNHPVYEYRELLYQISEEISYIMYRSGNKQLYVSEGEIEKIIKKRTNSDLDKEAIKNISERCYALCTYWKADARSGFAEFYHNNIRDFFLSEWIYRNINSLIKEAFENLSDSQKNSKEGISEFVYNITSRILGFANESFSYAPLSSQVCKFIYLRSLSTSSKPKKQSIIENAIEMYEGILFNGFPYAFLKYNITNHIFNVIFTTGAIYPEKVVNNPIKEIINVFICCAQIFRYSSDPFLRVGMTALQYLIINSIDDEYKKGFHYETFFHKVDETIMSDIPFEWWNDIDSVNQNGIFSFLFRSIFSNQRIVINGKVINLIDKSNLSNCDLRGCDLRDVDLSSCILLGLQFQDAIMDSDNNAKTIFEESKELAISFEKYIKEENYVLADYFIKNFFNKF